MKIRIGMLILILLYSSTYSFGQALIKGKIRSSQQGLPVTTVLLLQPDSFLVRAVLTDSLGYFIFRDVMPGDYMVSSSMVGYTNFCSGLISVKEKNITLPDMILEKLNTELREVVVTARKPFYEQKIDRIVVNVQSSITSTGNTVLEVLEKSPGILVNKQNNSIGMNGKTGVQVMINNRPIKLPMEAVSQMLGGMNASNVEKIELVSVPPAKYDAEGTAGVINIIMKVNPDLGTKGSFGLMLGLRWAENLGADFNLNHRSARVSFFVDYSVLRNHNLHLFKMARQLPGNSFNPTVKDFSHRENTTTQQNLIAGAEWNPTNSMTLNLSLTAYRRNWDLNAFSMENNQRTADSTVITNMKIHESNIWQSITAGIGLQTKIDQKQTIDFDLDYLYYHNSNPSGYDNSFFYNQTGLYEHSIIDLKKTTPIWFFIASGVYQYNRSPSLAFEAGMKSVTSTLSNDVFVRRFVNNTWISDSFFSSASTLHEQAGAMYVSTKWQPANHWQFNAGLRYEYTHSSINTPSIYKLINRKYGYLFPSLFLRKELKNGKDIQFSYTKRITRPTYNDIAPWVFFWDPGTFSGGNTSLLPAIADAVKADYHEKQWIISIQFTHSRNEISFLQPEVDTQSNYLIYRSQNMKYLNTVAITNSLSLLRVTGWWQLQTNVTAQYQNVQTSHLQNNKTMHMFGFNTELINSFNLPGQFSIEISGRFQSKALWGISYSLPTGALNAGIKKRIGEKGTLRLSMDDILSTSYWRFKTYLPQNKIDTYFSYDFHNQYVRLSYTRNFGNSILKTIRQKSGSEEERKRVSN